MTVELTLAEREARFAVENGAVVEIALVPTGAAKPNFEAPSSLESHWTLTPY